MSTRRFAIYVRVSTDKGQTVDNQLIDLQHAAERFGWTIVAVHRDEGISGAKGRDRRPGFDALLRGIARREYDIVAAWSVCRLGRSLPDLIAFLGDLNAKAVDLYLHQQGLDTTTPCGRMLFQMLGVFAEFERAITRDRIIAGQQRARAAGVRFGRPPISNHGIQRVRDELTNGKGIREAARITGISPAKVLRIKRAMGSETGSAAIAA
jgi:DNA invertase Pin-like site-specific DNA recombinase